MAYIGQSPSIGNFQVCDAISVVNGQAAYTMQVSSVNVVPETANHMIVSLNGIIQKPGSSFTVSGSTITFASNLVTGDVIDFIHILGSVLDLGVPSDATVTNAKTNFTTTSSAAGLQIKGDGTTAGALQLNCEQNSHGIKLQSPAHSANQSYTLKFPTGNVTADRFLKVASVSGSGTTGVGQLSFEEAGGTHVLLQTQTVSSSVTNVDFTSNIDSTYKVYMLDIINMHVSTTGSIVRARFFQGGSVVTSSIYDTALEQHKSDNNNVNAGGTNSDVMTLISQTHNNNDNNANCRIYIFNPADTTFNTHIRFETVFDAEGDVVFGGRGGARIESTTAVDGIRIFDQGGTIDSGIFKLYGIS